MGSGFDHYAVLEAIIQAVQTHSRSPTPKGIVVVSQGMGLRSLSKVTQKNPDIIALDIKLSGMRSCLDEVTQHVAEIRSRIMSTNAI